MRVHRSDPRRSPVRSNNGAAASPRPSQTSAVVGDSRLNARSVLASALLGADQPCLAVGELVGVAMLCGITANAARTCLWRMVSSGELTCDNGTYALAGHLLELRQRKDEAAQINNAVTKRWDGTWELAVVALDRRSRNDRLKLRKAAAALHLAELREGIWVRPDNLDARRLPMSRAVLEGQCVYFHGAATAMPADIVNSLFALDTWAADARRLIAAMDAELDIEPADSDTELADGTYNAFALSKAVVEHLLLDPLLPAELTPKEWPGHTLRCTYRRFDDAIKQRIRDAFRRSVQARVSPAM